MKLKPIANVVQSNGEIIKQELDKVPNLNTFCRRTSSNSFVSGESG
ncbi:unnamed protein product, partial [Rotaria magnacalcarata]